jgi:EAL domain-containing protein (putative c-di-GMP-specific phosphodiesterase class I)
VGLAPAIVQLAHTLGHTTIAEGIENANQAVLLRQMGCQLGQGYHLAVPQDAEAIGKLLRLQRSPTPTSGAAAGR